MGPPPERGDPFSDPEVFVSQTQANPSVYHSQPDCPRMPAAYTTLHESLAEEEGLRECTVCIDARLSFLEL